MRIVCLFLFCLSLFCAPNTVFSKEKVSFTVDETKYQLEAPGDWEISEISDGLQLTQKDKKASVAITVLENSENITLASFQQTLLSRLNLTDVKKTETKKSVFLTGLQNGLRYSLFVVDWKDSFLALVSVGVEKKMLDTIFESIEKVQLQKEVEAEKK